MGQAGSSRPILAYEDAVDRLGDVQVDKIREGFSRLAVRDGQLCRTEFRNGFLNSIAGVPVPEDLAAALFNAFDFSATGHISEEEFVCGLAVLQTGSKVERLRLLFAVYDADRDKRLSDRDLQRFASALDDGHTRDEALKDALEALRAQGPSLGFEHFETWAKKHMNSPLIQWVNSFSELKVDSNDMCQLPSAQERMRPLERSFSAEEQELDQEILNFSGYLEINEHLAKELQRRWRSLVDVSPFQLLDLCLFSKSLKSLQPDTARRLFVAMDSSGSGTVSLKEWLAGLKLCFAGSEEERCLFCFAMLAGCSFASVQGLSEGATGPSAAAFSSTLQPEALQEFRRLCTGAFTNFTPPPSVEAHAEQEGLAAWPPEISAPSEAWGEEDLANQTTNGGGTSGKSTSSSSHPKPVVSWPEFSAKSGPYAARAAKLVLSIGYLLRVDLGLQPSDWEEECAIVDFLNTEFDARSPGKPGDTWYLISARWWQEWQETKEKLPINNGDLLQPNSSTRVKVGLCEAVDFKLITEGAWRALLTWHGGPGPSLPRHVIKIDGRNELELHPLCLHICRTDEKGEELLHDEVLTASRSWLLREVKEKLCGSLSKTSPQQPAAVVVLRHRQSQNDEEEAWQEGDESKTLHEQGFIDGHRLLISRQIHPPRRQHGSETSAKGQLQRHKLPGLQNLGNTCYMNSSMQCLLNAPLFPDYFEKRYLEDVNFSSSWGMCGKLAVAFSELLAEVSKHQHSGSGVIAPRGFMGVLRDFEPLFGGFRQHDAQEFLSIFLAGLSDDVNRTAKKPYIELKDSEQRPDGEVAREFWSAHCRREQSVVAACFSSQFKSVAICKVCGHENATFDPFSFLPVPLPEHNFRWVTCIMVSTPTITRLDHHSVQVCVRVPKRGLIADLLAAVAGLRSLPMEELVATDVANGYVHRRFDQQGSMSTLNDDARPTIFHVVRSLSSTHVCPVSGDENIGDIDVEQATASGQSGSVLIYLVHRRLQKVKRYFMNPYAAELFNTPLLLTIPPSCHGSDLYKTVFEAVRHLVPDAPLPTGTGAAYPFSLSLTNRDGSACSQCSWREGCLGCRIPPKSDKLLQLRSEATLGIDWDAKILEKFYKPQLARHVHIDESVELARIERNTPESLAQCLERLVGQEEIVSYCKDCTKAKGDFTEAPHDKGFKIWAGGPLLVFQLKRFQVKDGTSYKLHNLVTFPVELDIRPYLAQGADRGDNESRRSSQSEGTDESSNPSLGENQDLLRNDPPSNGKTEGKSTKGTKEKDKHILFNTLSREHTVYDLFGVVNHIGGMGSGHYTAFVRKLGNDPSSSSWWCCDDERVYAVKEEDVVSMNAYLLFYTRRDVATGSLGLEQVFPSEPDRSSKVVRPEDIKRRNWSPQRRCGSRFSLGNYLSGSQDSGGFCGVM